MHPVGGDNTLADAQLSVRGGDSLSIPDNSGYLSKPVFASLLVITAVLVDGLGIWMAASVGDVDFAANFVVWLGILHASYCFAVGAWMLTPFWRWRAAHFGAAALLILAPGYLCVSYYLALALHTGASGCPRLALLAVFILLYGYTMASIFMRYKRGMSDSCTKEMIYVKEPDFFRYVQQGDVRAREKRLKVNLGPRLVTLVAMAVLCATIFLVRDSVVSYFGVSLMSVLAAIVGFSFGTVFFACASMCAFVFFYYPAVLRRDGGLPVYVDLTSSAPR